MDEIIDNPNTLRDLFNAADEILPSDLRVSTPEGMNILATTLRNEQVAETFLSEAENLRARHVRQVDAFKKTIEVVEDLPDIGRRELPDSLIDGVPTKPLTENGIPYERIDDDFAFFCPVLINRNHNRVVSYLPASAFT